MLAAVALAALATATCPITNTTNVAVFKGTGAMADCVSWETHFWSWWASANPGKLNVAFLDNDHLQRGCQLASYPDLLMYVQPGGNAYDQQHTGIKASGKANIVDFVGKRGMYIGTCAGWYVAANDYWWEGQHYSWPNVLGLYPTVEGSITDIIDFNTKPGYRMTKMSNGESMIYFGGPTRGWHNTPKAVEGKTLLEFAEPAVQGLPAAVQDGNKLFFSVHAEAFEGESITGLTTAQRLRNYKWRAQQINEAAGTNFVIPE